MINPSTKYPSQIDTTDPVGYPQGKAKNVGTPGDGTGTPLERDWVNDVFGFFQAVLAWFGTTPSGTPEKVGASQVLTALQALRTRTEVLTTSGTWTKPAGPYTALRVRCVAGGPGGGSAAAGTTGGGGASGEDRTVVIPWSSVPSSVTYAIGAGGTVGAVGGNTNFGSLLTVESLGFGGNGVATQMYGGGGGGRGNGANGVAGGAAGGQPANNFERVQPRGGDSTGGDGGGYSHALGWGGGGRASTGGNVGGAGAWGRVSNGGGAGGGGSGYKGGRGGGPGGGIGDGFNGAGYGGGGGGTNTGGQGGGGGGGGAVDILGAPASVVSTSGQPGVIELTYW